MFEFNTTADEVRSFAAANDLTPFQAKQAMYKEARVRYMMELMDRVASGSDTYDVQEALLFLLQREIEKNMKEYT